MEEGFEDALGEWTLRYRGKYKGTKINLEVDDANRYLGYSAESTQRGSGYLLQEVRKLIISIMERELKPTTEEEKKEITKYVSFNMSKVLEDAQVNLGGTSRAEIENFRKEELKNLGLRTQGVKPFTPQQGMQRKQGLDIKK